MNSENQFNLDHQESDRMHLASLVHRMADPAKETFLSSDAQELFKALEDLPQQPTQMKISGQVSLWGGRKKDTGTGMSGPDEDHGKFEKRFGRDVSYRCGTYVMTRAGKREIDIRHVADMNADSTEGEVLRIARKNKVVFIMYLNKPLHINIPFIGVSFVLAGIYKGWKRSVV